MVVFLLGFVADPIINMYLDPWSYVLPWSSGRTDYYRYEDDEPSTWTEHFAKGFTGMGVIGFLKVILASPFYFRMGGGRGRQTGRDRYEQISWIIILIGVATFLVVRVPPSFSCTKSHSRPGNLQRRPCMESSHS